MRSEISLLLGVGEGWRGSEPEVEEKDEENGERGRELGTGAENPRSRVPGVCIHACVFPRGKGGGGFFFFPREGKFLSFFSNLVDFRRRGFGRIGFWK